MPTAVASLGRVEPYTTWLLLCVIVGFPGLQNPLHQTALLEQLQGGGEECLQGPGVGKGVPGPSGLHSARSGLSHYVFGPPLPAAPISGHNLEAA